MTKKQDEKVKKDTKKHVSKKETSKKHTDNNKTSKPQVNSILVYISLGVVAILLVGALIFSITTGDSPAEDTSNENLEGEVVATVNGEEIYRNEIIEIQNQYLTQNQNITQEQALEQAVTVSVVRQKIENDNLLLSVEEVESQLQLQLESQGMTIEEFKTQIESQGQSYDDLIDNYQFQFSVQEYLDSVVGDIEVSDEEVEEYYTLYSQQTQAQGQEVQDLENIRDQLVASIKQQKRNQLREQHISSLVDEADVQYT